MIETARQQTSLRAFAAWVRPLYTPRAPGDQRHRLLQAVDLGVLVLYAAVVALAIHHHLASDDESQTWLLARDNSLHDLLFRRMHYEGAPGLWPSILWFAIRLHLPFTAINWMGGAFACMGILLLLFRSPFPPIIRWLLPFTFFFAYQYAVIARPYTLFAALLFVLCILFPQSPPRPILFAIVAGLMMNIGLHASILSGVFALVYLDRLRRRCKQTGAPLWSPRLAMALGIFCIFAFASAAVAVPAADVVIAGNPTKPVAKTTSLLARMIPPERLPYGAPALDPPLDLATLKVQQRLAKTGGVEPLPLPLVMLARAVLFGLDAATFAIAQSNLLSVTFLACLFVWLRQRRALHFALPWLVALVLSSQVLILDHHAGQFAMALLAAVWLALESQPPVPLSATSARTSVALVATALVVILLQIGWTVHAISFERTHPYDPGRATAEFLRTNLPGKRIAGFSYESVSTEANSPSPLFFNQPAAYWIWSGNTYPDLRRTEARLRHPDAIVQGDLIAGDDSLYNQWGTLAHANERNYQFLLEDWKQHGYRETQRFCGQRVGRLGITDTFCEVILEPDARASVSSQAGANAPPR